MAWKVIVLDSPEIEGALRAQCPQLFEMVSMNNGSELMEQAETCDLLVVSSTFPQLDALCRSISRLIPVVVMVDAKHSDWRKLKSLDVHGFIQCNSRGAELAARLQAIIRRYPVRVQTKECRQVDAFVTRSQPPCHQCTPIRMDI